MKNKKKIYKYNALIAPPNITNNLHFGHAIESFITDIILKKNKFYSKDVYCVTGCDHAGIATELMIKSEFGISNKENQAIFENRNKIKIFEQLNNLYCSFNFEKFFFTKDDIFLKKVDEIIKILLKNEKIFSKKYLLNFCISCNTVISDIEIEEKQKQNKLYYLKYTTDSNEEIIVATTRPETLEYDVCLISRYKINNKYAINPINNKKIPIYINNQFSTDFGSSIFKLTPIFSKIDNNIAKKLNIEFEEKNYIINGKFHFMNKEFESILEAREYIINLLNEKNIIQKIENINSSIPACYKCKNLVEVIFSKELFINLKHDKYEINKIIDRTSILPNSVDSSLIKWKDEMENWCISRSLSYGIKINICFCGEKILLEKKCDKCNNKVYDTWFTSSLATIVASDISKSKQIDLIVCGKDILFFWIIKMILMHYYYDNEFVLKKVILHGMIKDEKGQKLSKSLGNYIPLNKLCEQYENSVLRLKFILNQKIIEDMNINFYNFELENKEWFSIKTKLKNLEIFFENFSIIEDLTNSNKIVKGFLIILNIYERDICYFLEQGNIKHAYKILKELTQEYCNYFLEISKLNDLLPESKTIFNHISSIYYWFFPELEYIIKNSIYFEKKLNIKSDTYLKKELMNNYYEARKKFQIKNLALNISVESYEKNILSLNSEIKKIKEWKEYNIRKNIIEHTSVHKINILEQKKKIFLEYAKEMYPYKRMPNSDE